MILTKKIKIRMNGKHIQKYRILGYQCVHNDIIEVNMKDVPLLSKVKVEVKCDYCGLEKSIKYCDYNSSLFKGGKYSCINCSSIKNRENTFIKYGIDSTNKLEETKQNKIKSCLEKYGVKNISEISQDKVRKSKKERYGDEKYNNRLKALKTMKERYGVDNALQDKELFNKQQKSGFKMKEHNKIKYRGSYERDFLIKFNNIEICEGISLKYFYDGKNRTYHSDFYPPKYNLICEIKSLYYYNKYLEKNLLKKEACERNGYNFIFIIDKNYEPLFSFLKSGS